MLITQMHEKGVLQPPLTHNIQMMMSELHEEDPNYEHDAYKWCDHGGG